MYKSVINKLNKDKKKLQLELGKYKKDLKLITKSDIQKKIKDFLKLKKEINEYNKEHELVIKTNTNLIKLNGKIKNKQMFLNKVKSIYSENDIKNMNKISSGLFIKNYFSKTKGITKNNIDLINGNLNLEVGSLTKSTISLKNCPKIVNGSFYISSNFKLKSLKGSPKVIIGDFFYGHTNKLENLEGGPQYVLGDYEIANERRVSSLKGFPEYVGGDFSIYDCNRLKSLDYYLWENVKGKLDYEDSGISEKEYNRKVLKRKKVKKILDGVKKRKLLEASASAV